MVESPFVDPEKLNNSQVFFFFCTYAYVLYNGSNQISDGSELLQLVPSIAGLVGSVVLPILGAVPDGMMVLFSGIGPNAQEQVAVGVGALAGSTIMLLTLPWCLAILGGRVTLFAGEPQYKRPADAGDDWDKLVPPGSLSLSGTGVGVDPSVALNAKLMMLTSMLYLLIQIPATLCEQEDLDTPGQSKKEHTWALVGLVTCIAAFVGYLYIMASGSQHEKAIDKAVEAVVEAIKSKRITLRAVVSDFAQKTAELGLEERLLDKMPQDQITWFRKILFPFYIAYDANGDRTIDKEEFKLVLSDLGEPQAASDDGVTKMFEKADKDASGKIEFDEFVATCAQWALDPKTNRDSTYEMLSKRKTIARYLDEDEEQDDDDEDGDEDVPEDLVDLSPEEQQRRILFRSFYQMGLGTLMVLIFSDPMVDILSEIGNRTGVSSFYIAFVLAPLASNASELIAAYNYAQKKTQKSMAISLSTLCGAGCMNNTFCLAIFMFLVYFSGLAWQFTAETISIIVVQLIVGCIVLLKRVQTLGDALLILGLYPLSLLFVWFLENKVGLD